MQRYVLFSVLLIFLLILIGKIEINYTYPEALVIKIRFSVFEITLWNFKSPKGMRAMRGRLRYLSASLPAYKYILSRSDITIEKIRVNRSGGAISKNVIGSCGIGSALITLGIAYLSPWVNSISDTAGAVALSSDETAESSYYFSITESIRTYHALFGLLIGASSIFLKSARRIKRKWLKTK